MGISLNNKWFTRENLKEYILWGLEHTKEKFGVEIADTLQAINYRISSKYTKQAAIRKGLREGDKFVEIINEILKELPKDKRKKVDVIRWEDIKKDELYKTSLPIFQKEFKTNQEFKEEIRKVVIAFSKRLDQPVMKEEKIEGLCEYVIEELPELLNGFSYNNTYYSCFLYPSDALLLQLIEKIQNKEIFLELHDKLNIKNNVFVELKIK